MVKRERKGAKKDGDEYLFEDRRLFALLSGKADAEYKDLDPEQALVGYCISNPKRFPYLVGKLADISPTRDLRLGLIAIQIDAELKMRQDLERYQVEKYIAQSIEKILYGDVLLEGGVKLEEKKGKGRGRRKKG